MAKSTPPSLVEKVSTSEIVDTEEEVQFKRYIKRTSKEKLQAKDDSQRYSTSDIQLISYLLDVPDVVSIQYQEGDKPDTGAQNVSLQVSLPMYQNITDETVIEAQPSGSKEGSKEQETQEQVPERSYVGYYEGTIGLFEKPVTVVSSKKENVEGARFFCLFLWLCIIYCMALGNIARVYPWIIQGLMFYQHQYKSKILACIVQVDAFIISL